MIRCALSDTTVEKLYKSLYKHMSDKKSFNAEDYMAYVFGNKAALSTPETSAKIVQHIPRMIIDIYNTEFLGDPDFNLDLNAIALLGKSFLNEDSGINNIISKYTDKSKKFLRYVNRTQELEAGNVELQDQELSDVYVSPFSFMPYSALSGTSQELVAIDPTSPDFNIETIDQSKRFIYTALEKMKASVGDTESPLSEFVYQGKTLNLQPTPLLEVERTELDQYTQDLIARSLGMQAKNKDIKGVTRVQDQIVLLITDDQGNKVYFNQDGDISTKEEGGRLAYQFLRDVRKEGNNYNVYNIYGYSTILDPAEIAMSLYKVADPEVINNIARMQQEEFELLYKLKETILNTLERPLLPITGISKGVFEKFVGKTITLNKLASLANIDSSVFKSIKTIQKDRGAFKAGNAVINVNGAELLIDRVDVPADIARQVADVLTNKDIEFSVRVDFYKQFFNNKIDYRTRRHLTSGDASKNEFVFNYSNKTHQESKSRKFLDNSLDLSQQSIQSKSEAELKDMADKIYDVLINGKGRDGKFYPTKMNFNSELLKNERYMVYDSNTKSVGFGNYIDLIKTLPAVISLSSANKDVVNTYVQFGIPNSTTELVSQVQREVKEDKRTPTKRLKDSIVDKIKAEGPQVVEVNDPKKGFYAGKHYAYFNVKVDGIDQQAKVYFPNKSVIVVRDGKMYQDPTWPSSGQQVLLVVKPELAVNGVVYKDVVEVFTLDEATGNAKDYIGSVAERDATEYQDSVITEEKEELEAEIEENAPAEEAPIIDKITEKDTVINADNPNTGISDLLNQDWKGLDRSKKLSGKVTVAEIEAAQEWWSKSPLSKHIKLEHLANIVNSNAYARFITSGQVLVSELFNKEYGKIQIYNKGSMVDVYHEAWHAFSQLYLTKDEKSKLYAEVRNYKTPSGRQPYLNKSFKEIEELLAEDFRAYAKNPEKFKANEYKQRRSLFKKILDFLSYLFTGKSKKAYKTELVPVVNNNYPARVSEIYNKLYFADKNGLLNNLQPSFDNVRWDMLNRGIESIEKPQNDSLNRQDSMLVSQSIDSVISEMIDDLNSGFGVKSATMRVLNTPENRVIAYETVKKKFQEKLDGIKETLANDGIDYDTYVAQEIEEREPLTYEQEQMLNNVRILQTAIDNWGDEKKGVVKFHKENSRFDIIKEDYSEIDVDQDEVDENGDFVDNLSGEEGKTESDIKADKVGKKSLEQLAQKEALYIAKSLFKITDGKTTNNSLGFKQLADFPKMWKILMREIGGVKDPVEMYDKLVKAAESYIPEFKQLVYKKLQSPRNITRDAEFDAIASFWQTFSRPRIAYMQLTAFVEKEWDYEEQREVITGVTTEVLDASIDASNVIRKFVGKFKAESPRDNAYITKVDNIVALTKLDKLVKDFADPRNSNELDVNKAFEFANSIGIYLDDVKAIKDELRKNIEYYGLQYLYTVVKDFANIQAKGSNAPEKALELLAKFTGNPLNVFQMKIPGNLLPSLKVDTVYQKSAIKRLAELQGRYGYDTSNYSVLNPEGNLVNEFTDDSSISRKVDGINRAENIKDLWSNKDNPENQLRYMSYLDPAINAYVNKNRLQILNSIFATEGDGSRRQGRNLKLVHVAGTQVADPTVDVGTNTTSLDIYSKFLQEMHTMLKGGIQEFIRHASKKDALGMKVEGGVLGGIGKGKDGNLYVDVDQFSTNGNGETYAASQVILPYIGGELERIIKFKNNKNKLKNYVGYNLVVGKNSEGGDLYAGETFTAFDNVLREETKNKLLNPEFLKNLSDNDLSLEEFLKSDKSTLKQEILDDITNYFNAQTSENLNYLKAIEYIDPTLYDKISDKTLDKAAMNYTLVKAFTYNSWIHNFETIILNYGDMAVYNHIKEELHKRNTGASSGGPKFMSDLVAQNFINNIWNADGKDANGNTIRKTYGSVLAGRKQNEEYKSFHYDGTLNTAVIEDIERKSVYLDEIEEGLREQYKKEGKSEAQINDIVAKELKPYQEMNEADGAGYITIDAYRTLKKLENAWSNTQENLYQKIIKGGKISASEIANFFPVYKLQNYGELANTELPLTAMHKFALMPLIPSELGNSQLEHLHAEMLRNNIQYMTFKSGSKAGSLTSDGKPDKVFQDEAKTKLKDEIQFTKNTIYVEYLKNVTNVSSKYKTTITFPTQLRGLILDGMYNQGIITEKEYGKLSDKYHKLVSNYTELLKLELLDEIGFEYKNGKYTGDMSKFLNMVQKELGKRDMPEHLLERIGVNTDGTIKTDLSLHLEADTIEKMLLAVLTKRLIRQKVKGEALVQVPSSMYNGLWDGYVQFDKANKDDVKRLMGSNNLPFYKRDAKGTQAMKIAIALQGDFVNLLSLKDKDGNPIGTVERLNELIKDDEWLNTGDNRKAITITGARIPIQNLNSMEFAEVWHFLDPSAGNKVVVPTEIVAKAGSDFDVDKIFWMMPHIDTQGNYIKGAKSIEEIEKDIKKIKNAKAKPGQKKPSAKALIQKQKKAIENELLNITRDILATPANYASLVRPNETYLVKGIADELEPDVIEYNRFKNMHGEAERTFTDKFGETKRVISPSRPLEIGYNLHKHDVNMVVKDVLGISALQNKKHPIFKSIGAKMPATYKESYYDEATRKYVDMDRDYDMRLLLPHSTIEVKDANGKVTEHISLSSNLNQAGTRISDLSSHIMNGELDVEKDAWVAYIQANLQTIGVLNYLLEAGVPEKTAIYFVSQPLIRDYTTKQKQLNSAYSFLANKEIVPFQLIKYKAGSKINIPYRLNKYLLDTVNNTRFDSALSKLKDNDKVSVLLKGSRFFQDNVLVKNLKANVANGKVNLASITEIKTEDKSLYKRSNSLITNAAYYDAAVEASKLPGALNENGEFSEADLLAAIKNPNDPKYTNLGIAAFLHFIEIEKQIKGLEAVKRENPDTKLVKTVQQVRKKEQQFLDLTETSKVDPQLPLDIRNKSIISSFYINDLSLDLIEPVLPLRLNKTVSDYITKIMNQSSSRISNKFGTGMEGEERFTSEFNNAVINYIFQNFMSNFVDGDGNIVETPDKYRNMNVIIKPNIKNGVEMVDGKIYADVKTLTDQFKNKKYLKSSGAVDNYFRLGLAPFSTEDDPFPTQAIYNKYVFEREYLRTLYPDQTEKFLNQRALLNTFNRDAIVGTEEYSYTDLVMSTIKEFSYLADQYPVLEQLSRLPFKGAEKIVQLNNTKLVKGELAEIYYQNLKDLGDVNIKKVQSPEENKKISEVFKLFSLMMIHQHGVGYSKYGFVKALDDSDYIEVMNVASKVFLDKNLNEDTLNTVFSKLMSDDQFKNYVVSPKQFNSGVETIFSNEKTLELGVKVKEYVMSQGEEKFDALMAEVAPELTIMDVPDNVDVDKVMNEEYDDYVPVTYKSLSTIINRLYKAGVNIDNLPFLFNDFATDTTMTVDEFNLLLDNNLETLVENDLMETPPVLKFEGTMTFGYGDSKRSDVTADTTFDAILRGERTATTRYENQRNIDYWKQAKVGDIITWKAEDGRTVDVVVTKELHPLKGSGKTAEEWSKLEGWTKEYFNTNVRPKIDTAWQIEFKLAEPTTQPAEAPVSNTNKPKGQEVVPGIYVNQAALTKEEQLELFDYLKPYLEEQAAKTLKGTESSKMIGLGLRWDYTSNNAGRKAVNIPDPIVNNKKYGYYTESINGQPLGQITPRFRALMQKATGVDMTNYDGAIINLYEKDTFIPSHNDVDESKSAIKYPVIGINLGGKGNFSIERIPGAGQLSLEAGTGYIFGVDGVNREVWHRTFPTPQDTFLPELTTKIDGKTYPAGSYRITITMRRVMPLTEAMPEAPSIVSETTPTQAPAATTQPTVSAELPGPAKLSTKEQINILEAELAGLLADQAEARVNSIPIIIAEHMNKITPESARRETGVKIGTGKDINPNLLSNTGFTVEKAAEYLQMDFFNGETYPEVDEQEIRNYIIEILQEGKNNFIESYLPFQDRISEIRYELNSIKSKPVETGQLDLFDFPAENTITDFYSTLTEAQREKLGNLANVIDTYNEMYSDTMSVQEYIDNVLNCKI
jgi:hypothetical protein